MRIIIVGAGRTGTQLARRLVQEKHEVSLIESDEERARHASNRLDCLVLYDEGNSIAALEEAGVAKADALVCVTDSDEMNMIICGLVDSRYPGKFRRASDLQTDSLDLNPEGSRRKFFGLLKIARVRNDDYVRLNQYPVLAKEQWEANNQEPMIHQDMKVLGVDYFVHPDVEAARAVLRALSHGAMGNILDFTGTSYELGSISVAEGSIFDGLSMRDYRSVIVDDSLVILVERIDGPSHEYIIPAGSTVLSKGDRLHILAREELLEHIFHLVGRHNKPLRSVGIVGGGRVASLIAEGILRPESAGKTDSKTRTDGSQPAEQGEKKKTALFSKFRSFIHTTSRRVVIVEKDYGVCKELAARFPQALVLNEDISDESFVAEEHIGNLDLIITATESQEQNIIAAIYLKSLGVKRAIALVSGSGQEVIARQLGVDVVIPVQSVVVDSIHSNLMDKGVKEVHSLGDGSLEIFEVEIGTDSPVAGKTIRDFKLSEGGLIMLVSREESSFIPKGDYIFNPGDKLIFMARKDSEAELEKFFGAPKWRER